MGEPCQNYWFSEMEIQDDVLFNQRHKIIDHHQSWVDGDQIFGEIMHHHQQPPVPAFSSDSESHSPTNQNNKSFTNSNFMMFSSSSQHAPLLEEKPDHRVISTSPTSYILSFGDSTVVAATRQPFHDHVVSVGGGTRCPPPPPPSKGALDEKHELLMMQPRTNQTVTKKRSTTETIDHIMAERKRRRELTERFIALSATIPGLKKIDKATILGEAITHVKRLQERVRELEEQSKKICVESVSFIRKSHLATTGKGNTNCGAMNSDDCYRTNETLPTVEARVFKKDVLLRIHCKIDSGILFKILAHLKNLHLSTISNSVMPFGNSTLDISIIAQMGDKFNVTMNDLVKNLRLALLEPSEVQQ